jgi:hypothetical protein
MILLFLNAGVGPGPATSAPDRGGILGITAMAQFSIILEDVSPTLPEKCPVPSNRRTEVIDAESIDDAWHLTASF